MRYKPVIGLEIHVELKTQSKMFCACANGFGLEKEPNVNICPVCSGQPGTLPVINKEAVLMVLKTGLALNCQIPDNAKFDRKNYFYPDLPKGYQISQYDQPLCGPGFLRASGNGSEEKIGIRRVHLEEDTGKLVHPKGADHSLVDFNRAGVPLMELVTEPDITSGAQAKNFCQELQQISRYLGVSDADMEKGQMRCEVNISISADKGLGTKVEIKNLNSFRAVERSIDYEIKRQSEALAGNSGEKIIQETRGWDDAAGITFSQRTKEEAHDYRYFPEPDLPPLTQLPSLSKQLSAEIPELPAKKRERFAKEYGSPELFISFVTSAGDSQGPLLADYFEQTVSELDKYLKTSADKLSRDRCLRIAENYIMTEFPKYKKAAPTPENYAEFVKLVVQNIVSSSGAQTLLSEMIKTGADPSHIIKEKDLGQVSDEEELNAAVLEAISQNPGPVADYKKGKQPALMFLVGKVMAATKGKANPQVVRKILEKLLAE